jgi:hypothetical protein
MDDIFTTTDVPAVTANLTPWPVSFILPDAGGQPMVTISLNDGSIEYGPTYDPDAAARVFWDAMQRAYGSPDAVFGHGLAARVDAEMADLRQCAAKAEADLAIAEQHIERGNEETDRAWGLARSLLNVLRPVLEHLPSECRYHGQDIEPPAGTHGRTACCDTGVAALRRRNAQHVVDHIEAEHTSKGRDHR